ncbi:hypothetical protein SSP2301 [Staphylococcus saprophyticus subsp. saprophyticus ATCC 15305]|uniref:Uncharacterized protein n=1 Tax=Staphylococcus saprophyticus subsp. saprophyticus (strain ATCC 15305 / DSM 20229 / NCIMB 8711 / NCTC 7292 / S-41) TaxID=342451 RepID=Q49UW7_STAS1|nr:hypothetical protein SSP2301 [Staphylococcus saprophyticus subsp. saprophyticus ATCC 15305] [Staphylococcus saprophyticus subsp. saprophyticus ATCC 15305 = NCTC 7292]
MVFVFSESAQKRKMYFSSYGLQNVSQWDLSSILY